MGNNRGNDLINRKYRETYGASLVSRDKSQDRRKRRSIRKTQENTEKYSFNNTIDLNSRSGRGKAIGVDKGFDFNANNLRTIDNPKNSGKPYVNRRLLHY